MSRTRFYLTWSLLSLGAAAPVSCGDAHGHAATRGASEAGINDIEPHDDAAAGDASPPLPPDGTVPDAGFHAPGPSDAGAPGDDAAADAADGAMACPACTLLHDDLDFQGHIFSVVDGRFYWDDSDDLYTMALDGSDLSIHGAKGTCRHYRRALMPHGEYFYYVKHDSDNGETEVMRVRRDDRSADCETAYRTPERGMSGAYVFEPSTASFYFGEESLQHPQQLARLDLDTLVRTTVGTSTLNPYFLDGTDLFGLDNPGHGSASYELVRAARADGAVTPLANWLVEPRPLGVDATSVYYASRDNVYQVPRAAPGLTTPEVVLTSGLAQPTFYVDGSDLVWFERGGSSIHRRALRGGSSSEISVGPHRIHGLTWDANHYYFMASSTAFSFSLYAIAR